MFDISLKMNFNKYTMKFKGQKTYSITSNKFTYLERNENVSSRKVDINELNRRLNETKRSDFYKTSIIITLLLSFLGILSVIGFVF